MNKTISMISPKQGRNQWRIMVEDYDRNGPLAIGSFVYFLQVREMQLESSIGEMCQAAINMCP